jgi:hypothetical protein
MRTAITFKHMRNLEVETTGRARRQSKASRSNAGNACVRRFSLLIMAALLGGCASDSDSMLLLVDASKYQPYSCAQIADATKKISTRRDELAALIERAAQSPGGTLVGALAYQTEYTQTGQELQVLASTSRRKNCDNPAVWRSNSVIQ